MLFHPVVAQLSCTECSKRAYDLETGEPKTYLIGPKREIAYYEGRHHAPVCKKGIICPKGSPERAKEIELNQRMLDFITFWRIARLRKTMFSMDELTLEFAAVYEKVYEEYERHVVAIKTTNTLTTLILSLRG